MRYNKCHFIGLFNIALRVVLDNFVIVARVE